MTWIGRIRGGVTTTSETPMGGIVHPDARAPWDPVDVQVVEVVPARRPPVTEPAPLGRRRAPDDVRSRQVISNDTIAEIERALQLDAGTLPRTRRRSTGDSSD